MSRSARRCRIGGHLTSVSAIAVDLKSGLPPESAVSVRKRAVQESLVGVSRKYPWRVPEHPINYRHIERG